MISTQILKSFSVFGGLSETELTKIAKLWPRTTDEDGSVIFTIGGSATERHEIQKLIKNKGKES